MAAEESTRSAKNFLLSICFYVNYPESESMCCPYFGSRQHNGREARTAVVARIPDYEVLFKSMRLLSALLAICFNAPR